MKILFLGYVVSPSEADKYKGASVAGNKMQWNIISHLSRMGNDITCVSLTPHASFPKENYLVQEHNEDMLVNNCKTINPAYVNIPVLKQIMQIAGVMRNAYKYLKKNPEAIVLCYNLSVHIGIPFMFLKRKFVQTQFACIVADLPLKDDFSRRGLYAIFSKIGEELWRRNLKKCNKYIVLNENAVRQYIGNKPYIVVEGGVDEEDICDNYEIYPDEIHDKKKHIIFAGALVEYNGILELIDAMNCVNDKNIVLDIYGSGILEDEVKKRIITKDNVVFHGRVSNKQVINAQRNAWLIIATRHPEDPITKVTFPSKTFEILLSETPFLSTKLDCYLKEYSKYMFFIENNSSVGIAEAINKLSVSDYAELKQKAIEARKFVLREKLWNVQVKKIKEFIAK